MAQQINTQNTTPNNIDIKKRFHELKPLPKQNHNNSNINHTTTPTQNYTQTPTLNHNITHTNSENTNTSSHTQQTEASTTQTYAQTISQPQSLTAGQRTPTNERISESHKNQVEIYTTPKRETHTKKKEPSQTDINKDNNKQLNIEDSPIAWTLPTPLKSKESQREKQNENKENFSWTEIIKNTITTITNIINNMNSEKTILEIIAEAIKEITPIFRKIITVLYE